MKSTLKSTRWLLIASPVVIFLIVSGIYHLITGEPIPKGGGTGVHGGSGRIGGAVMLLIGVFFVVVFVLNYRLGRRSTRARTDD